MKALRISTAPIGIPFLRDIKGFASPAPAHEYPYFLMNSPKKIIAVSDIEMIEKRRKNFSDLLTGMKNAKDDTVSQPIRIFRDFIVAAGQWFGVFENIRSDHRQRRNQPATGVENSRNLGQVVFKPIAGLDVIAGMTSHHILKILVRIRNVCV